MSRIKPSEVAQAQRLTRERAEDLAGSEVAGGDAEAVERLMRDQSLYGYAAVYKDGERVDPAASHPTIPVFRAFRFSLPSTLGRAGVPPPHRHP